MIFDHFQAPVLVAWTNIVLSESDSVTAAKFEVDPKLPFGDP